MLWQRAGGRAGAAQLGGEALDFPWAEIREQTHEFFDGDAALTRINLPPATPDPLVGENQLVEWGGAQRWLRGEVDIATLRERLGALGGNVCAFRGFASPTPVFHPLPAAMLRLQRGIKSTLDPAGIFNPGRLFPNF